MGGEFRFIDLCAGIGGLRIPFDEIGGSCVFTSEIDASARATYAANFSQGDPDFEAGIDRDIMEIGSHRPEDVPDHDLLLAGFPCQPFSHAGKKLGFDDTRGTLFFSIANIIREKQPAVVLLENVKGLRNHDKGNTLKRILEILENPGPGVKYFVPQPRILNARDFGLPQNRERIFIIAIREDIAAERDFEWPTPTTDRLKLKLEDFLETNPSERLTISDRLWQGHQERKTRNKENGKGWGYQLFNVQSMYVSTISARYFKDGSEALLAQDNSNPRLLSPREVANLQGFPSDFILNESRQAAYKQLGNAVPVNVIRSIAGSLKAYLLPH